MPFSVRYLNMKPGELPAKLGSIGENLDALKLEGRLVAALYSEIGGLNRMLLLHSHDDIGALVEDQEKVLAASDAFGVAETTQQASFDLFTGFPEHELLGPGKHGLFYEVRTYAIKSNGVGRTMATWRKVLAKRTEISKLVTVMYAVTGPTRFMHLWPYASLDERMSKRGEAVAAGVWPPPGGILEINTMQSEIFLPAAFSPTQ